MRDLFIFGEDLSQVMGLAASLTGYFRPITVLHADDPVTRVLREPVNGHDRLLLLCLTADTDVRPITSKSAASFVVGPGSARERLMQAGVSCLDPDDPPARVAATLDPHRRRRHCSFSRWSPRKVRWASLKHEART
jgi:hypothetical protein